MDSYAFVGKLESTWDKNLPPEQSAIYVEKTKRFSNVELDSIFDHLTETCKFFPKIADVFSSATDLGLFARKPKEGSKHDHGWTRTNCRLCEGEGRIYAVYQLEYERTDSSFQARGHFVAHWPYSSLRWGNHQWSEGQYTYCFRCACPAGDAATIPKSIPRWDPDAHRVRQQQPQPAPARATVTPFRSNNSPTHISQQLGDWNEYQPQF